MLGILVELFYSYRVLLLTQSGTSASYQETYYCNVVCKGWIHYRKQMYGTANACSVPARPKHYLLKVSSEAKIRVRHGIKRNMQSGWRHIERRCGLSSERTDMGAEDKVWDTMVLDI